MCRHPVASEPLSGLLVLAPAQLLAVIAAILLPLTPSRGVQHGDSSIWFQWRNPDVALVEFLVMMPLVMMLIVSARKTTGVLMLQLA